MKHAIGSIAIGALVAGCAGMAPSGPSAVADLAPTTGNTAKGTVTFAQKGDKVVVVAKVSGLAPGNHGFHIHEKGDCSSGDGMSAGGHFNPLGKPHAHPSTCDRHAGDMPMLIGRCRRQCDAHRRARRDHGRRRRGRHRRQGRDRPQGPGRLQDAADRQLRRAGCMRRHPQVLMAMLPGGGQRSARLTSSGHRAIDAAELPARGARRRACRFARVVRVRRHGSRNPPPAPIIGARLGRRAAARSTGR